MCCEHVFVKRIEREAARRLRAERGLAINRIAQLIGVSKSSVSLWVRDIELTQSQQAALRAANPRFNQQRNGSARIRADASTRRRLAQAHGRTMATAGDPLHRSGCMLYWAEGSKQRNRVVFTNSDPEMVELFLRFLRRCYGVEDDQVALTVNVHLGNGLTLHQIENWWLRRLHLPSSCVRLATVNQVSRASKRRGRTLPYGTVRLAVASTFIVQSIYGAIQAYGGFDRPEWLDCGPAQTLRVSPPSTSSEVPVM
jgi:hypothetical protein